VAIVKIKKNNKKVISRMSNFGKILHGGVDLNLGRDGEDGEDGDLK